jgi:hypothetical protein
LGDCLQCLLVFPDPGTARSAQIECCCFFPKLPNTNKFSTHLSTDPTVVCDLKIFFLRYLYITYYYKERPLSFLGSLNIPKFLSCSVTVLKVTVPCVMIANNHASEGKEKNYPHPSSLVLTDQCIACVTCLSESQNPVEVIH